MSELSYIASEEVAKVTTAETRTSALRDRMDHDYGLFTLDTSLYYISESEGKWDNVITNRAASEGNKMIDYLSYARRMLWIPQTDETESERKRLTATEQLGNGCIYMADAINEDIPDYIDIQSALSFYKVIRGWSAGRYILRDDDDKLIPDIAVWDPRNTYWHQGSKRLTWVCYVRYATEGEIRDEYHGYNGKLTTEAGSAGGYCKVYDVWGFPEGKKEAHEGVIVGGEWVKEPEPVGMDYLPIRIRAGRSTPIIRDGERNDTMKHVGESFLVNNREMLPVESRLLTYKIHKAGIESKPARPVIYDSTKGELPPTWEKPLDKGSLFPVDEGKGQKIGDPLLPGTEGHIDSSLQAWIGLENMGGLSPIAHGLGPVPDTAQATDIVFRATMDALKAFRMGVEKDLVWYAEESVRQYKNGDFDEYELEGYDKGNNRFRVNIKPDQIDDKWRFRCVLIPDELREKATKMGIADQAVKGGFMSVESASDQFQIVENPSLEQQKIDRDNARKLIPELALYEMSEAKLEDLGIVKANDREREKAKAVIENVLIRTKIARMLQESMGASQMPKSPNVEGVPRSMPPSAETSNTGRMANTARTARPAVPGPVKEAARRRGGNNA